MESQAFMEFFKVHKFSEYTLCCKCLRSFACFYSKMPMFRITGMREGGRKATPTSVSIFDFYDIKFKLRGLQFHLVKWLKIGYLNFKLVKI